MEQTLDAFREADERAEVRDLRHPTGDHLPDGRHRRDPVPGIGGERFEGERDARLALALLDGEDLHPRHVTHRHHVLGCHPIMAELAAGQEPVEPPEVDERAEVADLGDAPAEHRTHLEAPDEGLARLGLLRIDQTPPREHGAAIFDLGHQEAERLADVHARVLDVAILDLRRGTERTRPRHFHLEAALVDPDDLALDGDAALRGRDEVVGPGVLAETEPQPDLAALHRHDECAHRLADRELHARGQVLGVEVALPLGVELDEDRLGADVGDDAFDLVPHGEPARRARRGRLRCEEIGEALFFSHGPRLAGFGVDDEPGRGFAAQPQLPPRRPRLRPEFGGFEPSQMLKKARAKSSPSMVPFLRPFTTTWRPVPGMYVNIMRSPSSTSVTQPLRRRMPERKDE